MTDDILDIITEYCDEYDIDLEEFCLEMVYQDDERSIGAMDYFVRILEACIP